MKSFKELTSSEEMRKLNRLISSSLNRDYGNNEVKIDPEEKIDPFDKEVSELSKKYNVEESWLYAVIKKLVTKYHDLPNTDRDTLHLSVLKKLKELLAQKE